MSEPWVVRVELLNRSADSMMWTDWYPNASAVRITALTFPMSCTPSTTGVTVLVSHGVTVALGHGVSVLVGQPVAVLPTVRSHAAHALIRPIARLSGS